MECEIKEIGNKIWTKGVQGIILSAVGFGTIAWFILKDLFSREY